MVPLSYADVTSLTTLMEIPAGQTEATFPALVIADSIHEPTEVVQLVIMQMEGAQIDPSTPTAPITILDDDPKPTITVDDVLVAENDPTGHAQVHVHLSNPSAWPVTVEYRTRHRSARAGRDYVSTRGTVNLGPGAVDDTITISLVDDHTRETIEHFDVEFSHARHARLANHTARVWIVDDDAR